MNKLLSISFLCLFFIHQITALDYKKLTLLGIGSAIIIGLTHKLMSKPSSKKDLVPHNSTASTFATKLNNLQNPIPQKDILILPVLQQCDKKTTLAWQKDPFWSNIFNNAESTNCGYHALKNAISILQHKKSFLQDIQDVAYYQNIVKPWIMYIQTTLHAGTSHPLGNMISGNDIENLITQFTPELQENISVIDSFEVFDNPAKTTTKEIELLQKIINQENFKHAFIVNTDALKAASLDKGFHWVVYVIEKSPSGISIVYLDSLTTINANIVNKFKELYSLSSADLQHKIEAWQYAIKVLPTLNNIDTITKKLSKHEHYVYQQYAYSESSLGLLNFEDLHLVDELNKEQQQIIKNMFETNLPSYIKQLRNSRIVTIDGIIDTKLTALRQKEIVQQAPIQKRIFTLWKQNKPNGLWHIELDSINNEKDCHAYEQKCKQQYGIKLPEDKNLRRYDLTSHIDSAMHIKQIFTLIDNIMPYHWSDETILTIIHACQIINNQAPSDIQKEEYGKKMALYFEKIQNSLTLTKKLTPDLIMIHTLLNDWQGSQNIHIKNICHRIEQLLPIIN